MEPGHEDREYALDALVHDILAGPQWSPAMKTGNTPTRLGSQPRSPCLNGARP